jgi:hypothetical protein
MHLIYIEMLFMMTVTVFDRARAELLLRFEIWNWDIKINKIKLFSGPTHSYIWMTSMLVKHFKLAYLQFCVDFSATVVILTMAKPT